MAHSLDHYSKNTGISELNMNKNNSRLFSGIETRWKSTAISSWRIEWVLGQLLRNKERESDTTLKVPKPQSN